MRSARKGLVVLAASSVIAVSGVVTALPSMGGTTTVKATGSDSWNPASKTVTKGTKVVWKNPSGDDHNVVAYSGNWSKSSTLNEGGSTSFKFGKSGTYKYRCTLHSRLENGRCEGMCGKIIVR